MGESEGLQASEVALAFVGPIAALLGVAVGLFGEQLLRRRGEVRREIRSWVGSRRGGVMESRGFGATFFNDKDINIALWDPRVEFRRGDELLASVTPRARIQGLGGPIDLPSRTTVELTLNLDAEGGDLERFRSADRVEFVADVVPGGLFMEGKIVEPLKTWDAPG